MEIATETQVGFHALLTLVKFSKLRFNEKSYSSFRVVNVRRGGRENVILGRISQDCKRHLNRKPFSVKSAFG